MDSVAGWAALRCPAICSNLKLNAERITVPPILPSKAVLGHVGRGRTKYRRESDAKVRDYSRILEKSSKSQTRQDLVPIAVSIKHRAPGLSNGPRALPGLAE